MNWSSGTAGAKEEREPKKFPGISGLFPPRRVQWLASADVEVAPAGCCCADGFGGRWHTSSGGRGGGEAGLLEALVLASAEFQGRGNWDGKIELNNSTL